MFDGICEALHREMDQLDEKFAGGAQMSGQELEHIDKMAHALKSLETYKAMKGNSEYDGGSYARGRSRMTGRYISRDERPGYNNSGYNPQDPEGYSRRYY
jgi:hypothetical protein